MDETCASFGSALRQARIRQKLTQEGLAERSGLSYKFIGEVERGKGNPTLTTMARLADALGEDLATLLARPERSRTAGVDYRISKQDLQRVSEAVASIETLVTQIVNPNFQRKRKRRR